MVSRRLFLGAAAAAPSPALSKEPVADTLANGMRQRGIPCVVAMVADAKGVVYEGAFGTRDAQSGVKVQPDSIFAIASMTKAITTAAALQLWSGSEWPWRPRRSSTGWLPAISISRTVR